jgi:hypothetical protein
MSSGSTTTTTTTSSITTTTTTLTPTTTTTTTILSSQIHKLSLGELNSNFEEISLTWQSVGTDYDTTPLTLLDENGVDQGLTLNLPESTISINVRKIILNSGITSGDAEFPDDVLIRGYDSYGAFISQNKNAVIRISGCTNDTYTFKIYCTVNNDVTGWAVSDTDYTELILSGGTADDTSSLNPINNSTVITLSNTPNDQGYIDICFTGNEDWDHPVMNAIIISK